jgi:hypothetical protein
LSNTTKKGRSNERPYAGSVSHSPKRNDARRRGAGLKHAQYANGQNRSALNVCKGDVLAALHFNRKVASVANIYGARNGW